MTFYDFSKHLQKLENTSSRLEMTEMLASLFEKLKSDEVEVVCYLMQGRLVPKFESKEFYISEKMMVRVLARIESKVWESSSNTENLFGQEDFSQREKQVQKMFKQLGDLGEVGERVVSNEMLDVGKKGKVESEDLKVKKTFEDTILSVYNKLCDIAEDSGEGSQDRKVQKTASLLTSVSPSSVKYIIRIIIGNMRLGFSDKTIIDALSWFLHKDKSVRTKIEQAYQKRADIGYIAKHIIERGEEAIGDIRVRIGAPIIPALCQRLNTAEEIIEKMGEVYAEPKYDGTRVQIHVSRTKKQRNEEAEERRNGGTEKRRNEETEERRNGGTEKQEIIGENSKFSSKASSNIHKDTSFYPHSTPQIHAFTRNLEDVTHMYPELYEGIEELDCENCILDVEAIGYDPDTGELVPFQQTITRKRKHGIEKKAKDVPLKFFVFDVLFLDNSSFLHKTLQQRKQTLKGIFKNNEVFVHTPYIQTSDPIELRSFHEEQLAKGLEGAVMKRVDSKYVSGRKGWAWVKIKETEGTQGKLSDTLDCIVMGYYRGKGKRSSFGIGAFLVGVRSSKNKVFTISKIGTGLTDEQWKEIKNRVENKEVSTKPKEYNVPKELKPDVWVSPSLVVEIAADELTHSPLHSAKVALRFPRLLKFRDDKNWEQSTTLSELKNISIA